VTWIDSRHTLPPSDEEVLMWHGDAFFIGCFKSEEDGIWFNYEVWCPCTEIGQFFWQPLPDPPETT